MPPLASTASSSLTRVGEAADIPRHCTLCGYDLRGLESARCPECGTSFDPDEPVAHIPWLHRIHLGRWSAFLQTTRMVLLHPNLLARNVHPSLQVDAQSATHYRAVCGMLAAGGVAISVFVIFHKTGGLRPGTAFALASIPWTLLFCYLASIPTDTTGLRWTDTTIRFRWLHDFTSAPLALAPPILIGATILGFIFNEDARDAAVYPATAAGVILAVWVSCIIGFQVRAARRRMSWVMQQLIVYFWWWGLLALFCVVMTGLTAGVVSLVIYVLARTQ